MGEPFFVPKGGIDAHQGYLTDATIHAAVHTAFQLARQHTNVSLDAVRDALTSGIAGSIKEIVHRDEQLFEDLATLFETFHAGRNQEILQLRAEVIRLQQLVVEPMIIGGSPV